MSEQNQNVDNRSASQKISDLENTVIGIYQTLDMVTRDLGVVREAIKLLGNKVEAIVRATNSAQPLTNESLAKIMIELNCEELAEKTREMVARNAISPSEQIAEDSFMVCQELNASGEVKNPRLQLAVMKIVPDARAKLIGAKSGDVVEITSDLKIKVLEVYQIVNPQQPQAVPTDAPAAPEQSSTEAAPAAPAAEESAPSA